jgi:hypothetical protein
MTRRGLLGACATGLSILIARTRGEAAPPSRPLIGAIRWDAWYDPDDGPIAEAVERSLGPHRYHFRLPYFGKETGPDSVRINGYSQDIIDSEIKDAVYAGLQYWAFDAYDPTSPMSNALKLYLSSTLKNKINFCLISDIGTINYPPTVDWQAQLLNDGNYQRVLNQRPLYYLFAPSASYADQVGGPDRAKQLVADLRATFAARGIADLYLVVLNPVPQLASDIARALGADAIGAYALSHNLRNAPFAELAREVETLWDQFAATSLPLVPPISTGWDRRPRAEHPVPWDSGNTDTSLYYDTASPAEIGAELQACLRWMSAHRDAVPANTALIYAWNENDEGGWLVPTYKDDRGRIEAVRRILVEGR